VSRYFWPKERAASCEVLHAVLDRDAEWSQWSLASAAIAS
jgi:hypothetical protein